MLLSLVSSTKIKHSALLWVTKPQQCWKNTLWDFPDGPGVKNSPCDAGSIPDGGTESTYGATKPEPQLESVRCKERSHGMEWRSHVPQLRLNADWKKKRAMSGMTHHVVDQIQQGSQTIFLYSTMNAEESAQTAALVWSVRWSERRSVVTMQSPEFSRTESWSG